VSAPHIAYLMYWGALEPVGLATAVPTVLGLSRHARVTLVSFEKEVDWGDEELVRRTRRRLEAAGVHWVPLGYSPGYRSTPIDVLRGMRALYRVHRRDPLRAVEGRTFVGGVIGAMANRLLRVPFLYHTEGCWVEEQVDVGKLREGSVSLRVLRTLDRWIAGRAGALIALTPAGASLLRSGVLRGRPEVPVAIVPTTSVLVAEAADVPEAPVILPGEPIRVVYSGSVTGRYLVDDMLVFVRELFERRPGSRLEVLAHRDRDIVRDAVERHGLADVVTIDSVPHDELPSRLRENDLGLFFLRPGRSEACVSPTKTPEYLAHGLVVASTRASGDGAGVVERARVGVILDDPGRAEDRERAFSQLDDLLEDPERSIRGLAAAREHYSLTEAVSVQWDSLQRLMSEGSR
jgi:glycosyltransferase involved in cell wall biosynthesis